MSDDATTALLRALCADFAAFPSFGIEEISSRSWASATFTGARHVLTLRLEGHGAEAAADNFLDNLEEREFTLRGHILADIKLASQDRRCEGGRMAVTLRIEALTVEDG